ncbi:MAG TPA: phosphatase [Ruminococcaceae bacterium]|nr:phosphatase [Oscillospiraceae bacterium]
MIRADLHMHSTASDGSATVEQLILMAKNAKLTHIAITDHDMLLHNAAAVAAGERANITILPGLEFSAIDHETGVKAHILGYYMHETRELCQLCATTRARRHANSLRQIEILKAQGIPIDIESLASGHNCIYKQHIMTWLVLNGYAQDMFGAFYLQYFKNGGICDFDMDYLDARDAVRSIRNAGGLAILAHPGQQKNFALIRELIPFGLSGVEYRHPDNNKKDMLTVQQLCEEYHLCLTGGSDYHGINQRSPVQVGDFVITENLPVRI